MQDPAQTGRAARPPAQLPLDLDWPRKSALRRSDFVVGACNEQALEMLDLWEHWPDGRLLLCGPESCGKTHLAAIWATEAGARFVEAAALDEKNVRSVADAPRIVLEDLDRALSAMEAREMRERALLHLINIIAERRGRLLISARMPPARWGVALADLESRLKAITLFRVGTPDDSVMSSVVLKQFGDRMIAVSPQVAQFLARRLDRRFAAVAEAVERLDRRSVALKRPVTVAMVKEEFGW